MNKGFINGLTLIVLGALALATGLWWGGSNNNLQLGTDPRVLTVRQGGTGQSSFGSSTLLYGNDTGKLQGTSSPVVTYIIASSTSATSSFEGGGIIGRGIQLKNYTSCNLDTDSNGYIQCGADATAGIWTADQDADGFDLFDVGSVTATSGSWLLGTSTAAFSRPFAVHGGGFFAGDLTVAAFRATNTAIIFGNATSSSNFEVGSLFGVGGDYFNDLTGTGLSMSGNALQSTLGTSITLTSEVDGILPIANGGSNAATFNGNLIVGFDGTRLVATGTPSFTSFYATSTTATSTIAGNFEVIGWGATTSRLAVTKSFATRPASTTVTSGSIVVDWDSGSFQQFFVTGTTDFVINSTSSHPVDGGNYKLRICNTGANTVTFSSPGTMRWFKGTTTIPTTNKQCAWIGMIYEATHGESSNIYSVLASSTPISY